MRTLTVPAVTSSMLQESAHFPTCDLRDTASQFDLKSAFIACVINLCEVSAFLNFVIQGGSNMNGTNCDLFTHNQSRLYLNHLVYIWQIEYSPDTYACIYRGEHKFSKTRSHLKILGATRFIWFKFSKDQQTWGATGTPGCRICAPSYEAIHYAYSPDSPVVAWAQLFSSILFPLIFIVRPSFKLRYRVPFLFI
jgi:hypothetical protein